MKLLIGMSASVFLVLLFLGISAWLAAPEIYLVPIDARPEISQPLDV